VFLSKIAPRLYQNYLMRDRLDECRELLAGIQQRGYRFITLAEFAQAIRNDAVPAGKLAILRVDVDSDPRGARRMFDVERALGIRATYYFRLGTIDRALIAEMARHGTEVGYHFEELSTLARQRGFRRAADAERARSELQQQFRANLSHFRRESGVSPRTIAAHGDFLNRRLGLRNNWFVDRALLNELNIIAEGYEPWVGSRITARVADRAAPVWWYPRSPEEALKSSPAVLLLVMHPRQWVRNSWANACADFERLRAEIQYRLNTMNARI
jgi:peptidoglycan/xylan/chitin deacetylase (PgdA/CDA1 family)